MIVCLLTPFLREVGLSFKESVKHQDCWWIFQ